MRRSIPDRYVRWVNDQTGDWGTWQPFETVDLGDVGYFNRGKRFVKVGSAANILGVQAIANPGNAINGTMVGGTDDFAIDGHLGAGAGASSGMVTLRLERGRGHLLYVEQGELVTLQNEAQLVAKMQRLVAAGRWRLDWVLVTEHLRAPAGFAASFKGSGSSITLDVAAPVPVGASLQVMARAGLTLQRKSKRVSYYPFGPSSTPTFDRTWRIYPGLRNALYGGNVKRAFRKDWFFRDGPSNHSRANVIGMNPFRLFEFDYAMDSI